MEVLNWAKYFAHALATKSSLFSHDAHQLHGREPQSLRNHFSAIFARNDQQAIFFAVLLFPKIVVRYFPGKNHYFLPLWIWILASK